MRPIIVFLCKRGRLKDIPLLKEGASSAGMFFVALVIPFAFPVLPMVLLAKLVGIKVFVIFSDWFVADHLLARPLGSAAARMLWNYADEWPNSLSIPPNQRVCFFESHIPEVRTFRFAPTAQRLGFPSKVSRKILFLGDVVLALPKVAAIEEWDAYVRSQLSSSGFGVYLSEKFFVEAARLFPLPVERRLALVHAKNVLRYAIVAATYRNFGDALQIVGSNWRKLGIPAVSSKYSATARISWYRSAAVNLDCGSKSGDSSVYPRSSEIISYAGAPVQVIADDSVQVYGSRTEECVFSSEAELFDLLEKRLLEPDSQRLERANWLMRKMSNDGLTMQESLRSLTGIR